MSWGFESNTTSLRANIFFHYGMTPLVLIIDVLKHGWMNLTNKFMCYNINRLIIQCGAVSITLKKITLVYEY